MEQDAHESQRNLAAWPAGPVMYVASAAKASAAAIANSASNHSAYGFYIKSLWRKCVTTPRSRGTRQLRRTAAHAATRN